MSTLDTPPPPVTDDEAKRLFDFLSTHPYRNRGGSRQPADAAIGFGRADPLVATHVTELYKEKLVPVIGFTGGVGKDAGPVLEMYEFPEAAFLAALAVAAKVPFKQVFIEDQALDGAANCRLGYKAVVERLGRAPNSLYIVIHATSLRRLAETWFTIAGQEGWPLTDVEFVATGYKFRPDDPNDRLEAAQEMMRLVTWQDKASDGKPWLRKQHNLLPSLVDIARRIIAEHEAAKAAEVTE